MAWQISFRSMPRPSSGDLAAWFLAQGDKTFNAVAGGAGFGATYQNGLRYMDVVTDGGLPSCDNAFDAWTGFTILNGRIYAIAPGGHGDRAYNDATELNLRVAQPGCVRLRAESADTVNGDASSNGTADFTDGRPRATHSMNRTIGINGRILTSGMDNMSNSATISSGEDSSAYFTFRLDTNDYVAHGRAWSSGQWATASNFHGGATVLDPTTGYVWVFSQGTSLPTDNCCYVIDSSNWSVIRRYVGGMGFGYCWGTCLYDKSPKMIVIAEGLGPSLRGLDISSLPADGATLNFTTLAQSGTLLLPGASATFGAGHYHAPSNAILAWDGTGTRTQINKIAVPSDVVNGTYAGSMVSASGANTITPSAPGTGGPHTKFNLVRDLTTGRDALVMWNGPEEPCYVYKLPAAGL